MFRIHLTQVDAMATDAKVGVNISLTHSTQILLLKSVDTLTDSFEDFTAGLSKAQLSNVWTHEPVPIVIEGSDRLFIITSIIPVKDTHNSDPTISSIPFVKKS